MIYFLYNINDHFVAGCCSEEDGAVMCLSPFETLGRETLWWIPGAVWVIKYLMGVK